MRSEAIESATAIEIVEPPKLGGSTSGKIVTTNTISAPSHDTNTGRALTGSSSRTRTQGEM